MDELLQVPGAYAQKSQGLRVDVGRLGEEVLGAEDEELLARKVLEPALELIRVHTAG